MPAGRAGDDADPVAEAEIHAASLDRRDGAPPRSARRDRLEPRAPLPGPRRPAAQRDGPRAGARARRASSPARRSTPSTRATSRRARETAEIVAARLDAEVVAAARAARDRRRRVAGPDVAGDRGALSRRRARAGTSDGHGWESGETYEQLGERVVAALRRIAAAHPGQRVLVVGHGGTIRATRAFIEGVSVAESRRPRAGRSATARCSESSQRTAPSGG